MNDVERLRYPIGRFETDPNVTPAKIERWLGDIDEMPERLRSLVAPMSRAQLDTPYRPGGWTVRQLVHHVADSHLNAYIRFKLALTEDNPSIKTYDQDRWAELADVGAPIETSLKLIEALHDRWCRLLRSMDSADFARPLWHPESGSMTISDLLQLYSWHSRHHTLHIERLIDRNGW